MLRRRWWQTNKKNGQKINNQKGQTFLEFIFLLMLLSVISFTLMAGFNNYIGTRWQNMLKIIAIPAHNDINVLNGR